MVLTICSVQLGIVTFCDFRTASLTWLQLFNLCAEKCLRSRYHSFRKRCDFRVVVLLLLLLLLILRSHPVHILLYPTEIWTLRVDNEYSMGIDLCSRGHRCLLFLELYHRIWLGCEAKVMLLHHSMMLIHALETFLFTSFRAPLLWVDIGHETAMEACIILRICNIQIWNSCNGHFFSRWFSERLGRLWFCMSFDLDTCIGGLLSYRQAI